MQMWRQRGSSSPLCMYQSRQQWRGPWWPHRSPRGMHLQLQCRSQGGSSSPRCKAHRTWLRCARSRPGRRRPHYTGPRTLRPWPPPCPRCRKRRGQSRCSQFGPRWPHSSPQGTCRSKCLQFARWWRHSSQPHTARCKLPLWRPRPHKCQGGKGFAWRCRSPRGSSSPRCTAHRRWLRCAHL